MRRSSSKLITRARSIRNTGKVPFRFKFDLIIETVEKLTASGDIVVVWERGSNKFEATNAVKVDRNTRKASFDNEQLSSEVTLFKLQPSERRFQDKIVKLAVKSHGIDGKTIGKIHLNLADYAEVPAGSKRISAELTNGAALILTIQCSFLSMGKTSIKGGAKSDIAEDVNDEDDLEDDLEGDAKCVSNTDEVSSTFLKGKLKLARTASKMSMSRPERRTKDDENCSDLANVSESPLTEKLKRENQRLKKQLEEAERNHSSGDVRLMEENKTLKTELQDLKIALAREPVYSDVVKELKEAKMALALLHLEKEEVVCELMKVQREERLYKSPR